MTRENDLLKANIKQFYALLESKPDEVDSVHDFVVYLRSLLRLENIESLPKMEVMTLIKHYKPTVFEGLQRMASQNIMLDILIHLSMDLETAEENLKKILE